MKTTRLHRWTSIRKRRSTPRRGELSPAEKGVVRDKAYERSGGLCELVKNCSRGILPYEGDEFTRAHLVHLRTKRNHGWAMSNVAIGCYAHHRASHDGKLKLAKTYDELIGMHTKGLRLE